MGQDDTESVGQTDNGGTTQTLGAEGHCHQVISIVACFCDCY